MKFLAVSRAVRFSPHSVARDAAVMARVVQTLRADGHVVECVSEDEPPTAFPPVDGIVSMARDGLTLSLLDDAVACGTAVINSPQGVRRCGRAWLAALCRELAIPSPATVELTAGSALPRLDFPVWLKRGDACAQQAGDVVFVGTAGQLPEALDAFAARGITSVVAVRHLEGELIKFYGVEHTPFFFTCHPRFSKFGLEAHNVGFARVPFSVLQLQADACRLAAHIGVPVFGGDAVVGSDGVVRIIDFNDWPSFSPCLEEAVPHIVQRFYQMICSCKNPNTSR